MSDEPQVSETITDYVEGFFTVKTKCLTKGLVYKGAFDRYELVPLDILPPARFDTKEKAIQAAATIGSAAKHLRLFFTHVHTEVIHKEVVV